MLVAFAVAAAAPADTPRAFIDRVYAGYAHSNFNPLDRLDRIFAPELAKAIREDQRLAKGEVGYLDGDPICQCQDPAGLHAAVRQVMQQGRDRAIVRVSIVFAGENPRPATFRLFRTVAGWRIADISSTDEQSLLKALEASNRKQRAKH
jgi:hypothetical protein